MIRVGIVGCGGAAWIGHLPWIWENPHAELVAACALNTDHAEQAAKRWGAAHTYADFYTMLDREQLDAVVIATPPDTHAEYAIAASRRGLHVLLEKPMALSSRDCDAIIQAAAERQTVITLGHEKRFNPGFEEIKRITESGTLGRVFYLVIHWSAAVRLDPESLCPPDYRSSYLWRWTNPAAGGGILFDHLPHYFDLWRWWTGSELESIDTELLNVRRDWIGDQQLGGVHEDFALAMLRFQNGCLGLFETGTVGRGLSPIQNVGSATGEWSEYGLIYGTRGHLVFDALPWDSPELPRIMVFSLEDRQPANRGWYQVELPDPYRAPGGPLSPKSNSHYQFKRQMDHFIECIRNRTAPRVTAADGRATVAAVEAAYESFRSRKRVFVSPSE
ncbi:MAG: Gfo/Idh/MocA family protein [Pirellulales bacterium]